MSPGSKPIGTARTEEQRCPLSDPHARSVDRCTKNTGDLCANFLEIGPALGEGRAVAAAMDAIARQPESAGTVSRTLFVGLAMIETMAIYALVVALLVLFANPFVK
jgi:F-type H+-transporting ATPase subunit c